MLWSQTSRVLPKGCYHIQVAPEKGLQNELLLTHAQHKKQRQLQCPRPLCRIFPHLKALGGGCCFNLALLCMNAQEGLRRPEEELPLHEPCSALQEAWQGRALPSRPLSCSAKLPQGASLSLHLPHCNWAHFFFNARADRPGNIKPGSFAPLLRSEAPCARAN